MTSKGACYYYQRANDEVKGRHLIAAVDLRVGDLILAERPLLALQSRENLAYNLPCHGCHAFVGGPDAYLQRRMTLSTVDSLQQDDDQQQQQQQQQQQSLCCDCGDDAVSGSPDRDAQVDNGNSCGSNSGSNRSTSGTHEEHSNKSYPCRAACGHVFCSAQCEDDTWRAHHAFLCTGDCPTMEHPLVQFKQYATATNEILLLVAEWWVAQHSRIPVQHCHQSIAVTTNPSRNPPLDDVARQDRYTDFTMKPWWEVLEADPLLQQSNGVGEAISLQQQLREVCQTAAVLLNKALEAKSESLALSYSNVQSMVPWPPSIPHVTALDIACRIGAVEQNCMGVLQRNPLCRDIFDIGLRTRRHQAIVRCLVDAELPVGTNHDGHKSEDLEPSMADVSICLAEIYINETFSARAKMTDDIDEEDCKMDAESTEADAESIDNDSVDGDNSDVGDDLDLVFPPLDCVAMYAVICKMNHSCDPNVVVLYKRQAGWGPDHPLTAFCVALKDIAVGEELTISYIDVEASQSDRQIALANYGFQCQCHRCHAEQNERMNDVAPTEDVGKDKDEKVALDIVQAMNEEGIHPVDFELGVEVILLRRLERLDTIANQSKYGILPSKVYDALSAFVLQTCQLICTDERGLASGSVVADLLRQCVNGIEQRDYCLCQIVGCDLEGTLLSAYRIGGDQWESDSHREAYYCGALTACLGYSYTCNFVAARRISDRAQDFGLPSQCVECVLHFIRIHSFEMLVGPLHDEAFCYD